MAETIAQINTAPGGDTFDVGYIRLNELANAVSTIVVTVNTHANGGLTTGNGYVEGTFGARNLVANTMRGGTVETPGLLTILSNVESTGDTIVIGDVTINSTDITIGNTSVTQSGTGLTVTFDTNGTSAQLVDEFSKIENRGAEYVMTISDNVNNNEQIAKILVVHATNEAYTTEYGAVFSNTELGVFTANVDVTNVRVWFTPTSTNTHISGSVILLAV